MFLLPFAEAEKFLSVTLAKENLSPAVEKERSLLAEKLRKVKTQLGLQSDLPGGGKAPPRPPKGGVPLPVPVTTEEPVAPAEPEELYDDVAGNCSLLIYLLTVYYVHVSVYFIFFFNWRSRNFDLVHLSWPLFTLYF